MNIASTNTGFLELPNHISLNIFAVGCKFKCDGCQNPQLQDFNYSKQFYLTDEMLEEKLIKYESFINSVCWLGGDAIFQKKRLQELSKIVKAYKLTNCLYTGEIFDNIKANLLENLDFIIDGKWEKKELSDPNTNQRIWKKENKKWEIIPYNEFEEITYKG